MELECIKEVPVFNFTKGKTYSFTWVEDPEGWEVFDDNGNKEVFFDPYTIFEEVDDDDDGPDWGYFWRYQHAVYGI